MNSIQELKNYCAIDKPVGALLLTGEWGSGKTYLIEQTLKNALEESHIIVRISLFGTPSVEELHKIVKREWMHAKGGITIIASGLNYFQGFFEKASKFIPDERVKNVINSALAINFLDLIKIENTIDGKKVVLVFDDLERSKLSVHEKLGTINEYCENRGFNVIIVADEDRLKQDDYLEIKEKVVQRTVYHEPDYSNIVCSIINEINNESYKGFLVKNKEMITSLFSGRDLEGNSLDDLTGEINANIKNLYNNEGIDAQERKIKIIKSRPHNIRSLKGSLQDFERVYHLLCDEQSIDLNKWLLSFLAISMAAKANLIYKSDKYGLIFAYYDIELLYPGFFDPRYMPEVLSAWILDGVWNEPAIKEYISNQNKIKKESSPKELIKHCQIDYFEENTAIEGLQAILPDVYDGALSLNEYVQFIINSSLARNDNLFDFEIDWDKVYGGINKSIKGSIQRGEKIELHQEIILDPEHLSKEEEQAYNLIKDARESSVTMYESNRLEYINSMKNSPFDAFAKISNKRFKYFDYEMADATIQAFTTVDNPTKIQFPAYFEGIWINYRQSPDIDSDGIRKSEEAFRYLKGKLQELAESYSAYPFKRKHTEKYIITIDKMLKNEEVVAG